MEFQISVEQLKLLLTITKPVWKTAGNILHHEWIYFYNGVMYCSNGYVSVHRPVGFNHTFALSAKQADVLIRKSKEEFATIIIEQDYSGLKVGKAAAQFSYPFSSIEDQLRHFSVPTTDFTPCSHIKKAVDYCIKTVAKENIQFSNMYLFSNKMYSTDGYRITVVNVEGISTSIPYGMASVLFDEPDTMTVDTDAVHFKVGEWVISGMLHIGEPDSIVGYVPVDDLDKVIEFPDEAKEIVNKSRKFDNEYKLKDLYIDVIVKDGNMVFQINGIKSKYRESIEYESDSTFGFRINPAFLEYGLSLSNRFKFEPGSQSMIIENDDMVQYLWVEPLDIG